MGALRRASKTLCIALTVLVTVLFAQIAAAAIYTVTKTADTNDGTCDSDCSLREAIGMANGGVGGDTIIIPAGSYVIAIGGGSEDANATGDFDITQSVTLTGAGAGTTIIDGGGLHRPFHIIGAITIHITGVTIQHGFASDLSGYGGGIFVNGAAGTTVTVADSAILDNSGFGSGIFNEGGGALIVRGTTVSGNRSGGSGIYNNGGTLTVTDSTLTGNEGEGGGITNQYGTVTITNTTITGNDGYWGGGIRNDSGTLTVTSTTISGNTVTGPGSGGIGNSYGTVTVSNSIVANHAAGNDCFNFEGAFVSSGHNIESGTSCGFTGTGDLQNTNPLLDALADNGGPTQTMALLSGSPAQDSGACLQGTDQRGIVRPQGTRCDIGAYEIDMPCILPPLGLISWWMADGDAVDIAGSNNGTLQGGAGYGAGKAGQAFNFDGSDEFLTIPYAASLDFIGGDFSIDAWVSPTVIDTYGEGIAGTLPSNNSSGWGISIQGSHYGTAGKLNFFQNNDWVGQSDGTVPTSTWTHIAVTRSGSLLTYYINGMPSGSFTSAGSLNNGLPLAIGEMYPSWAESVWRFNGLLDEAHIFNYALSDNDIRSIYNAGAAGICKSCFMPHSGLVSLWRGEGDAKDAKGINSGNIYGDLSFTAGILGQAFSLDGGGDYVGVPAPASIPLGNAARSISAWVAWMNNLDGDYQTVLGYGSPGSSYATFNFQLNRPAPIMTEPTPRTIYLQGYNYDMAGSAGIPVGGWHFVTVTYDGTTLKTYVDGTYDNGGSYPGFNTVFNSSGLRIGAAPTDGIHYFAGLIDEVSIYNRALIPDEITAKYSCRPDRISDAFAFNAVTEADRSTQYTSNTIRVTGINVPVEVTIAGGEYSVGCTATFISTGSTVVNGDTVCVRQTSSPNYSTPTTATLTIGEGSGDFTVTTMASHILEAVAVPPAAKTFNPSSWVIGEGGNIGINIEPNEAYYFVSATDNCGAGGSAIGTLYDSNRSYSIAPMTVDCTVTVTYSRYPVWRDGTADYFMTIGGAYGTGTTPYTIKAHGVALTDSNLNLSGTAAVVLDGGYLEDFSGYSGVLTTITGPLTISAAGSVTLSNIEVK